jgi:putative FmdB family regulatory protein
MPIYEYRCKNCDLELEALQKISESPLQDCPDCGEPSLKKKVSAAVFRLKGSGWYETDFKTGDKKNLASGSGDKSGTTASGEKSGTAASGEKSGNAASGEKSGNAASSESKNTA